MKYRILNKESFTVMGKATVIVSKDKYEMLPQFWKDCHSDGTIAKLHKIVGENPIIGIGENDSENGKFGYMIGIESEAIDTELTTITIPKSTWVIFEPVLSEPQYVGPVWEYIFNEFLPNDNYNLATSPDLEVNYRIDNDSYKCEIWIPVIEKN